MYIGLLLSVAFLAPSAAFLPSASLPYKNPRCSAASSDVMGPSSRAASIASLLPLTSHIKSVLQSRHIETVTPIQSAALKLVHTGQSLTLHSETGSGKVKAQPY